MNISSFPRTAACVVFCTSLLAAAELRAAPGDPPASAKPASPATSAPPADPAAPSSPKLSGSGYLVKELAAEPQVIIAQAKLEFLDGQGPPRTPGAEDYWDTKFKITQFLKGKFQTTVYVVLKVYSGEGETLPVKGRNYLVFFHSLPPSSQYLSHAPGEKQQMRPIIPCLKLLPADETTVAQVKTTIAATPLRKPEPELAPVPALPASN